MKLFFLQIRTLPGTQESPLKTFPGWLFIILLFLFFCLEPENISAQNIEDTVKISATDTSFVVVDSIKIQGNDKTKRHIITREMNFREGDTLRLNKLRQRLMRNRNNIFNTGLFVTTQMKLMPGESQHRNILIQVKERWYIFPIPIFELSDRNFNEWWTTYNHDLGRTVYGIRLKHENFRGRNELLRIKLQSGFTKKYELFYTFPYIDSSMQTGLKYSISYSTNKSVAYETRNNQLNFHEGQERMRSRFYTGVNLKRRENFYTEQHLALRYHNNRVADTIASLNPEYFLNRQTRQQYFRLSYSFSRNLTDIHYYPTEGNIFSAKIEKLGLGLFNDINQFSIQSEYTWYKPLGNQFYLAGNVFGRFSIPEQQPYINLEGLGFNNNTVRGHELFVINGTTYFVQKNSLRKRLFQYKGNFDKIIPFDQFSTIPLSVYLKTYADVGYAHGTPGRSNNLVNSPLWGGGFGLDFVTFYDFVFRVEYSWNKFFKPGLFFHMQAAI